jgi:hypothetical protein
MPPHATIAPIPLPRVGTAESMGHRANTGEENVSQVPNIKSGTPCQGVPDLLKRDGSRTTNLPMCRHHNRLAYSIPPETARFSKL